MFKKGELPLSAVAIILARVFHTLGSFLGVSIREDYSSNEFCKPTYNFP